MGNVEKFEKAPKKPAKSAREEMGEERAAEVENWASAIEMTALGHGWKDLVSSTAPPPPDLGFGHRVFFLLFDWMRLRGVDKNQAARTAELLVNHRSPGNGRDPS